MQKGGSSISPNNPYPAVPSRISYTVPSQQAAYPSVRCWQSTISRPQSSPSQHQFAPKPPSAEKTIGRGLHRQHALLTHTNTHKTPGLRGRCRCRCRSSISDGSLPKQSADSRRKTSRERDWGCSLQFLASACGAAAADHSHPNHRPSSPARQRRWPCIIATSGVIKEPLSPFNFHPHQRLACRPHVGLQSPEPGHSSHTIKLPRPPPATTTPSRPPNSAATATVGRHRALRTRIGTVFPSGAL
ncbi:hypothetical protein B0T18DRAFT_69656 [Schizothecium vesticola]|uniref:Uncharacterized protein n=1 Tax=Schizothecium vesticola TaxID=314040 RepID=A0AA40F5A7_9PEZI|nr:hypothetical protein B0T18DRAFT_69656 [Schizothecium vesticola]